MQCLHPVYIRNPDTREWMACPCGKCPACRMRRTEDWITRLNAELDYCSSAYFATLTYDDEHLPHDPQYVVPNFDTTHVQKFHKRLRKALGNQSLRYFLVGEYGGQFARPHYHAIYFNLPLTRDKALVLLQDKWQNGFVTLDKVTPARIRYVAKYCLQGIDLNWTKYGMQRPPLLVSKRPAIGLQFLTQSRAQYYLDHPGSLLHQSGSSRLMPRYYRKKLTEINDEYKEDYQDFVRHLDRVEVSDEERQDYARRVVKNVRSKYKFMSKLLNLEPNEYIYPRQEEQAQKDNF